jgi:hypothetical protein
MSPASLTHDIVDMVATGDFAAAESMYVAHVTAEFEREDLGASEANMLDLWMAGALLAAIREQAQRAASTR